MRAKRGSRPTAVTLFVASLVLATGSSAFAIWSWGEVGKAKDAHTRAESALARAVEDQDAAESRRDARNEASRKAREAEAKAEQALAEARQQREKEQFWETRGYENAGDNVYFKWLDESEYSCGNWDCAGFALVAVDGCPGGVYLEAAIMSGESQVGWTNETFAAIPVLGSAAGLFEMVNASGDSFSLSEVSCR